MKKWYVSRTKKSLVLFVYVIVGLWSVRAFSEQVSPDSSSRPPVDPFECLPAIYPGDANLDGVVDVLDLSDVLSSGKFDAGDFSSTWAEGDFNGDTLVDVLDLGEMLGNFGLRAPSIFCNRDASRELGYPANSLTVTGFEFGQIERVLVDHQLQKDLQVFSFSSQSTFYARNANSGSDGQSLMLHPQMIQREKWALLIQGLSSGKHTIEIIYSGGKSEVFDFTVSSVPERPTEISAVAGDSQVALSWTAPSSTGGAFITDYTIQYSINGGIDWVSFTEDESVNSTAVVTGLANGIEYVFRVAARNEVGLGIWSAPSAVVSPGPTSPPAGSDVCGQVGSGCYDKPQLITAGKARLVDGTDIELVPAAGQFKVWKEKNGKRILNATGLWSSNEDWQALLDRKGTSFTDQDLTQVELIAGRACPPNVFLNPEHMTATGLCLYYDEGSEPQTLDLAKASGGLEGEDYLQDWNSPTSGRGEQASYYEGNIKNCADKGMRLPVLYETQSSQPNTFYYQPTDGINPVWPSSNGVPPLIATNTWTASAHSGGFWGPGGLWHYTFHFWTWSNKVQHSIQNLESNFNASIRCVLPSNPVSSTGNPTTSNTCGQPGDGCYDNQEAMNRGEAQLPDGTRIVLTQAAGDFKVWKERSGNRILNASGLVSQGWQKKLSRAGTKFTETDFTDIAQLAGRVCPPNVFLNHDKMTATGLCLYYDLENEAQRLDSAIANGGVEGEDWLGQWDSASSGRGASASFYEGNIKVCADKGMRLPTMYETAMNQPVATRETSPPQGDHINPTWATNKGVPMPKGDGNKSSWTASATQYIRGAFLYYFWWDTQGASNVYSGDRMVVRCVLP